MSDPVTFSILVNNYNYGEYLAQALDSALAQMQAGDELIIVDDGSTDESRAILERYRDRPGVILILQENQGQVPAVTTGMAAASKDVVLFLDSDDYYLDGYLDRLRDIYARHPEVSFVSARATPGGLNVEGVAGMESSMQRGFYPRGPVGPSRWSTYCFGEFLGVPTTGNSLRQSLSQRILPYVRDEEYLREEPEKYRRLFRLIGSTNRPRRFTPDGMIVRYASVFNAVKYHDDRPAFFYRVHSMNKFARLSWADRMYHQFLRSYNLRHKMQEEGIVEDSPSPQDLREEVMARSFPLLRRRRRSMKVRYGLAILRSRGGMWQKIRALAALPGAGSGL